MIYLCKGPDDTGLSGSVTAADNLNGLDASLWTRFKDAQAADHLRDTDID